jgi:hypothetical protein
MASIRGSWTALARERESAYLPQLQHILKLRFSATVGEEPQVELALV